MTRPLQTLVAALLSLLIALQPAGAAQAMYAGMEKGGEPTVVTGDEDSLKAYTAWRTDVSDTAKFIGALVGYATSGGDADNVTVGSSIAQSGADYNYLDHVQQKQAEDILRAIKYCHSTKQCSQDQLSKLNSAYEALQEISIAQDKALAKACATGDPSCSSMLTEATGYLSWQVDVDGMVLNGSIFADSAFTQTELLVSTFTDQPWLDSSVAGNASLPQAKIGGADYSQWAVKNCASAGEACAEKFWDAYAKEQREAIAKAATIGSLLFGGGAVVTGGKALARLSEGLDIAGCLISGTIGNCVGPGSAGKRGAKNPEVDDAAKGTPDNIFGPQTRVDGEAGVNTGVPRFDGTPTAHEARLGREIADQGNDVRIRGDNVAGPDAQINGNWYDIKELTGTSPRSLQRSVGSARNNFSNDGAADLGLSRSDTRALVDARGNATWDNPAAVRAEFDRLSRNGDFNNVAEVRVITSSGVENWRRP